MIRFPGSKVKQKIDISFSQTQIVQNTYNNVKQKLPSKHMFHEIYKQRNISIFADEFEMKIDKNKVGLYTFEVHIQNHTYHFLIDTGAQISGILKSNLNTIQSTTLDVNTFIGSVGGNMKQAELVRVERMFLGAIQIENQPFVVLEDKDFKLPYINISMMKFDGIIGWDILSRFDFELDDKMKKFRLLKTTQNFMFQNLVPTSFPVLIVANKKQQGIAFGFDSGAHDTWLGDEYVEKAKLKIVGRRKGFGMGVLGMETLNLDIIKKDTLYLHQHAIELINTRTGRVDMFKEMELAGVLGNRIMKGKKIQIFNSKQFIQIV